MTRHSSQETMPSMNFRQKTRVLLVESNQLKSQLLYGQKHGDAESLLIILGNKVDFDYTTKSLCEGEQFRPADHLWSNSLQFAEA